MTGAISECQTVLQSSESLWGTLAKKVQFGLIALILVCLCMPAVVASADPADELAEDLIPPVKAIAVALEKYVAARKQRAPAERKPSKKPATPKSPPQHPESQPDPSNPPSDGKDISVQLRETLGPNPYAPPARDYAFWPKLKPSFRDIPTIAPELSQPAPKVRRDHPRLLITPENRDEMLARFADFPALAKPVIAAVDDTRVDVNERAVCAAAIYAVGLSPKLKYTHTREEYGNLARQFALSATRLPEQGDGKIAYFLQCFVFDWAYDRFSPDERATIIKRYENSGFGVWDNELWKGYNCNAGLGMLPALAFDGDTLCDYVGQYWLSWWTYGFESTNNQQIPSICNRAFEKYIVGGQPYTREGIGYYTYSVIHQTVKRAYESATGDTQTLDYDWFNVIPQYLAIGLDMVSQPQRYRANIDIYNAGLLAGYYAPCTGSKDPKQASLSRWLHDQSGKPYTTANTWPGSSMLARMLVGNPRAVGKSPAELGLPTTFNTTDTWTSRSSWGPEADCVSLQSSAFFSRATSARAITVWSQGSLLMGNGQSRVNHGYADPGFNSTVYVYRDAANVTSIRAPGGNNDKARTTVVGGFAVSDRSATADYGLWHGVGITDAQCTVSHDVDSRTITIADTWTCAAPYVARIAFSTPQKPTWDADSGTLTLQNGPALATLTFDPPLAECMIRGGTDLAKKEFITNYDGVINPKSLVGDFVAKPTDKAAEADRIAKGGYYTVWLTPVMVDGNVNQKTTVVFK